MRSKNILWMTIILLFGACFTYISQAPSTTSLSVDPLSIVDTTLDPGETFTVNITVTDVLDLYAYEFKLGYETAVLTATEITVGPFLLPGYIEWKKEINDAEGWLYYSISQEWGALTGVDGSGVLATINFTIDHYGQSVLDLYETKLGNRHGQSISHGVIDGYFRNVDLTRIPVASFTYTPDFPIELEDVTFNASLSTPDGGTIVTYEWNFGDGNIVSEADPITTHNYTLRGTYTVTLTIIDSDDIVDTVKHDVTILAHDIAIIGVAPSSYQVWIGETVNVTVTMRNEGHFTETFNVTAYYNASIIGTQTNVSLSAGSYTQLMFTWNTTGDPYGNYTISATATTVTGETDTVDNTLVDGTVFVTIPGDVDGDGDIDPDDFYIFSGAYGTSIGDSAYKPECDIDRDGDIDPDDFYIFAGNYGKTI